MDQLLGRLAGSGDRAFIVHGVRTVTAAAFVQEVRDAAAALRSAGFGPGERLALYLEKGPECVVLLWAAAVAGGLAVPLHPLAKDHQVIHILADAAPFGVVTSGAKSALLRDPERVFQGHRQWVLNPGEFGAHNGPGPWHALFGTSPGPDPNSRRPGEQATTIQGGVAPADPAILFYTSGSTGMPKAVVQTHQNLVAGARIVSGYLGLTEQDVVMAVLPLGFDYGLNQVLTAAWCGAAVALHDHLSAADLANEIERRGATVLAGVPALWHELALWAERGPAQAAERLATLRLGTNSGGRLERTDAAALAATHPGMRMVRMYGLTEAFRSAWLPPELAETHPDSFGRAIPEVELLVVDPESGAVVDGPGDGELVHAGALVAAGYWQRPEATAMRFRADPRPGRSGTVVYSGDLVSRDAGGMFRFLARMDGMLKVDGHRLAPDEVHGALGELPGVRAMQVVGVADGAKGHRLVLFVVPAAESDPVAAAALEQRLARTVRARLPVWMVPREIRAVAALPSTDRGKRDLAALVRMASQLRSASKPESPPPAGGGISPDPADPRRPS